MKLEKEIQQKEFKNEFHKLAVNIIYTHSWLNSYQVKTLNEYNLTPQQYNILRILRGYHPKPATVNLLKERMLDKMSDASRLVERLRVKGLVNRKYCEKDRRRAEIIITESGLRILDELDKLDKELEKLLSGISQNEAHQVNNILDKMRG